MKKALNTEALRQEAALWTALREAARNGSARTCRK